MTLNSRLLSIFVLSLTLFTDSAVGKRKNWVLLVAGSKGWRDYGQQANVCHAYQIAHAHGIPDEQIVVMMYDDLAYYKYNPNPGELINQPDGPNVYPGVPKDYTSKEVNADVFLAVLRGDTDGVKRLLGREGKVIDSGPEDHVFVSYTDHGGPGIVAMPAAPSLYATDLNDALKNMHADKKFDKLVFYMEACYSGSMFDGLLPDDINVYATTAATPTEIANKYYYDYLRKTYLSTEYGAKWMENCDEVDLNSETLQEQFAIMREQIEGSHAMQYGDMSFTSLNVSQFLGNGTSAGFNSTRSGSRKGKKFPKSQTFPISSDEAAIFTIQQLMEGPMGRIYGKELAQSLDEERWLLEKTEDVMQELALVGLPARGSTWAFTDPGKIRDWDCYKPAVQRLFELCPRLDPSNNDYILQRLNILVNLCNFQPKLAVMEAIKNVTKESAICLL